LGVLVLVGVNLVACDAMKLRPFKKDGEAKMAALIAIGEKAKALPPLSSDKVEPIKLGLSDYGGKRNGVVMQLEELESLTTYKASPIKIRANEEFQYAPALAMLKGGVLDSEAGIKGAFERLAAIEHVVVIKVLSLTKPRFVGDGQFEPGTVSGEAHVFTLDGAKHHGGVRFSARSSPTVSAQTKYTDSDLSKDLGSNAMSDVSRKLAAQMPDYH
jgi:hypothetical protein